MAGGIDLARAVVGSSGGRPPALTCSPLNALARPLRPGAPLSPSIHRWPQTDLAKTGQVVAVGEAQILRRRILCAFAAGESVWPPNSGIRTGSTETLVLWIQAPITHLHHSGGPRAPRRWPGDWKHWRASLMGPGSGSAPRELNLCLRAGAAVGSGPRRHHV